MSDKPYFAYEGDYAAQRYKRGIVFHYCIRIPPCSERKENLALYVSHDGFNSADSDAMEALVATGECPPFIGIGVNTGCLASALQEYEGTYVGGTADQPGGELDGTKVQRLSDMNCAIDMRPDNYDMCNGDYPNLLVEELIPYLTEKYNLSISPDPDMHLVCGCSGGGMSALNVVWRRRDYFHRVFTNSIHISHLGHGVDLLGMIRKQEPQPIRFYSDYAGVEAHTDYGSCDAAAMALETALKYAGYDAGFDFHNGFGHGHHNRFYHAALKRQRFLWKSWQTERIAPKGACGRLLAVLDPNRRWERTDEAFPEKGRALSGGRYSAAGEYVAEGDKVIFVTPDGERRVVAEGLGEITGVALASDKWRLFVSRADRPYGHALRVLPDGSLDGRFYHGAIHTYMDTAFVGATDICVDTDNRAYLCTELGIQVVRSAGPIDLILDHPEGKMAVAVEVSKDGFLFAKTADGQVYKRPLVSGRRTVCDVATPVKNPVY